MKNLSRVLVLAAAIAVPAAAVQAAPGVMPRANLVQVADYSTNFQTFLSLAARAGVIGKLSDPLRPVTLLAPTDEAFKKLPKGTLTYLTDPRNRDELKTFVNNHIVPGAVLSGSFSDVDLTLPTEAGATVRLDGNTAGGVTIENADVITSTGVMHIVNQVIMPNAS